MKWFIGVPEYPAALPRGREALEEGAAEAASLTKKTAPVPSPNTPSVYLSACIAQAGCGDWTKAWFIGLSLLFFPVDAFAYLDPGTGSLLLQFLLATFVGLSVAVKIYWMKIKSFFTNLFFKRGKDKENGGNETENTS